MKRRLIWTVAFVLASGVALAGDYHTGTQLICSDCHVMHAQRTHNYSGGGSPVTYTPTHYLLKGPVNDTCLSCHDGTGVSDVLGNGFDANRSAGALNQVGAVVDLVYSDYMGHSLGSTDVAPGGSFQNTGGLNCTDCHHQHGYAGFGTTDVAGNSVTNAYRNLVASGGKGVSYAIGTNDLTKDVFETATLMHETINVNFNEPSTTDSGIATWCGSCHGDFHGAVGGTEIGGIGAPPEEFVRHPNATVNIGDLTGGHSSIATFASKLYRVRVMSPTGDWGTVGTALDNSGGAYNNVLTPTCISCHKAHGNARPFGLIYADGTGTATAGPGENGAGTGARDLCKQCHVQGG